jgi:hypothetical protein
MGTNMDPANDKGESFIAVRGGKRLGPAPLSIELQTGVTSTGESRGRHRCMVMDKIPLRTELHGAGFMKRNPS